MPRLRPRVRVPLSAPVKPQDFDSEFFCFFVTNYWDYRIILGAGSDAPDNLLLPFSSPFPHPFPLQPGDTVLKEQAQAIPPYLSHKWEIRVYLPSCGQKGAPATTAHLFHTITKRLFSNDLSLTVQNGRTCATATSGKIRSYLPLVAEKGAHSITPSSTRIIQERPFSDDS